MDDIPLNQLQRKLQQRQQQQQQQQQQRQKCVRKRETLSDDDPEEENDEEENSTSNAAGGSGTSQGEEEEADDIDWYDARILSYNESAKQFTVHFLGDDSDVTYEMALSPKIVRGSARAWTKRTLRLLCWKTEGGDGLLSSSSSENDGGGGDGDEGNGSCFDALPRGTGLPEDARRLAAIGEESENDVSAAGVPGDARSSDRHERMSEYKKLLAAQRFLATRLSPHDNDGEDEDDEDDDEGKGEDGPGPLADSAYVKHLCNCMEEADKACAWLMSEPVMLDVVRKVEIMAEEQTATTATAAAMPAATITKEALRSFLVNGAKFLNGMLASDPGNRSAITTKQQQQQQQQQRQGVATRRGGGRRKKRRRSSASSSIGSANNTNGRAMDDGTFGTMSSKAMVSDAALEKMLHRLLLLVHNKKSKAHQSAPSARSIKSEKREEEPPEEVMMTCTLTRILSSLFEKLWTPLVDWMTKTEDMISNGTTTKQFYSFEDIETQLHSSKGLHNSLALVELSSLTPRLEAKLDRARRFETEAWSVVRACTQPVVPLVTGSPVAAATINGSDGVAGGYTNEDDCLLSLRRLKNEASPGPSSVAAEDDRWMHNLDPLGRCTVDSMGQSVPSSLTRSVIDDGITVREWLLDLNQARTARERTSFVQDIIERYVTLPQLPTPPFDVGDVKVAPANPSVILAANTKDSITLLSSNCYSYNHIIGNAAARLQRSSSMVLNSNGDNDVNNNNHASQDADAAFLRSKEGVTATLAELTRLPVLSVVEEKLFVREELIDWNAEAVQIMTLDPSAVNGGTPQLTFQQIDALHRKLFTIINIQSNGRKRACQKLKPNKFIEDEIKAFAISDEKVICSMTGPWIREQYRRGIEWMKRYHSVVAILGSHGCSVDGDNPSGDTSTIIHKGSSDLVEVRRITDLLEEQHNANQNFVVSFPEEYRRLDGVRQRITQWANSVNEIVHSSTHTLQERCDQLRNASQTRPKGIVIDPSVEVINLWIRVFTWRLNLRRGITTMTDHYSSWKVQHPNTPNSQMGGDVYAEMVRLIRSVLAPLIVEGQEFLLIANNMESEEGKADNNTSLSVSPFLKGLRDKALCSILIASGQPFISKEQILNSGTDGMAVLFHILDIETDKNMLGSSLLLTRRVFWMMLFQCFFECLGSSNFEGNLSDAKALLSLCPHGLSDSAAISSSFMETNAEEMRLQKLINDAETLKGASSSALEQSAILLKTKDCCLVRKEELRSCLASLCEIQSNFSCAGMALGVKLLVGNNTADNMRKQLDEKIKGLTWLVSTFAFHPVLSDNELQDNSASASPHRAHNRICMTYLKVLYDTLPVTMGLRLKVSGDCIDGEIVRIGIIVKDLWDRANQWRSNVASLLPTSNKEASQSDHVITLDALKTLAEDNILSKVIIPELDLVQNIAALASQVKDCINSMFNEEYNGTTDVNKASLPDGNSLIAHNGDFILHRFTGSEMYSVLRQTLHSTRETAAQLPVVTPEKATLEWMAKLFNWVESIQCAGHYNTERQLVIKIEPALALLDLGHTIFYSVMDEVQSFLRGEKVGLQVFPQKFNVAAMKCGIYSLGLGLLRWAALLFECLGSDVDKEDHWKGRVLTAIDTFTTFERNSITGLVSSFRDTTKFRANVNGLIDEASNLIIQDNELIRLLSTLPGKMKASGIFQCCLEHERIAMEEEKYLLEKEKFENPHSIVIDRYELLDSISHRLPPSSGSGNLQRNADDNSLFVGEHSVRDKSRFALEKCLMTGMETLGLEPKESDARDFCSCLAWDLEDAVYEKYHNSSVSAMSNEYRDKVRSLRFNLQDPKNPMLCTRVLSGDLPVKDLISASTEALASNELKLRRKQVEVEAIKSVVLSAAISKQKQQILPPEGIRSNLAAEVIVSAVKSDDNFSQHDGEAVPPISSMASPSLSEEFNQSPASLSSPSTQYLVQETNEILASLPPPPMETMDETEPLASKFVNADDEFPSPPPSPLLSPIQSHAPVTKSRASHHISAKTGTDLFQFNISKLKLSFTTKIAVDKSCNLEVDHFLPSILVEKGRLNIDDFNKFIYEKTKSGRWNIAILKLSSITGDSNMSSYKKFYKQYESVGRLSMIQVSDTTKIFLITPKFLRVCKCLNEVENISRSSTYVVVLTKDQLPPTTSVQYVENPHFSPIMHF